MVETEFSLVRFDGDAERAGKVYDGLTPLTADDVADVIAFAATRPAHVNLDQIVIKPNPQTAGSNPEHPAIDWVNAQYDSIRGKIASRWRREADRFVLEVIIPANTRATVFIPAESAAAITESGRPLEEVREVRVLGAESGRVRVSVGCGKYRFVSSQ